MELLYGDRGVGKTKALIDWLMQGKINVHPPFWTRVIVCPDVIRVRYTQQRLRDRLYPEIERIEPWAKMFDDVQNRLTAMRNLPSCIWSLDEFQNKQRGTRNFEYAIDDFESLLYGFLRTNTLPTKIVMGVSPEQVTNLHIPGGTMGRSAKG